MTVTRIEEVSSSKVKVYVDEEFAFALYKGELRKYGIKEEKELTETAYREITGEVLPKRAKLRCMNLLQKKDYTRKQLADKLKKSFYQEELIEEALSYVESFHYVDDVRYVRDYLVYHGGSKSKKSIARTMLQRGISSDDFEKAYDLWTEEGNTQDEDAQIEALLQKKHFCKEEADRKELQRMYGFLARKGFESEKIYRALFR